MAAEKGNDSSILSQFPDTPPKHLNVPKKQSAEQQLLMNTFAWFFNVSTSVLIVFVNKQLMSSRGMNYRYATTLCALHYIVCATSMWLSQKVGWVKYVDMPFADLVLFTVTANLSIVSLNMSLMLNPVAFYQIAKLLIIPFVCFVEYAWLGRRFTPRTVLAVLTVVVGVGMVTVTKFEYKNFMGLCIAAISVVTSGMQQILCRTVQQKNKMASHELLNRTAPAQGFSLILVGPAIDRALFGSWVTQYEYSVPALTWLFASCAIAVLVNLSQFMCLGRFSAVSFQVLGHAKTFLVLIGGWVIFKEVISSHQAMGMAVAVAGMIWYGAESNKPTSTVAAVTPITATKKASEQAEPLLKIAADVEDEPRSMERKETV